jgi:hypothetical protein
MDHASQELFFLDRSFHILGSSKNILPLFCVAIPTMPFILSKRKFNMNVTNTLSYKCTSIGSFFSCAPLKCFVCHKNDQVGDIFMNPLIEVKFLKIQFLLGIKEVVVKMR